MPFQPINFAAIQPQGSPFAQNLVDNLVQGYKAGQMPYQMQQQQQAAELMQQQNALKNALIDAKQKQIQNKMSLPFGGEMAPGSVGQAMWIDMIGKKYGTDSQEYALAKQAHDSELNKNRSLLDYRDSLIKNMGKKNSTILGKEEQEIADVQAGFMPGTNRQQELSPDEQFDMLNRYKLKRLKDTSDSKTRDKALYASNIDKTLDMIDPQKLTMYSGLTGKGNLTKDKLLSAFGSPSQNFIDYNKAITDSSTLAKQVRQFYGDSITPQIQEKLSFLTNPSSWENDPKVAISNFNEFKNLLKKETETYRNSVKNISEFQSKDNKNSTKNDDEIIDLSGWGKK